MASAYVSTYIHRVYKNVGLRRKKWEWEKCAAQFSSFIRPIRPDASKIYSAEKKQN